MLTLEIPRELSEYQGTRPVIIYTDNQSAIRNAHNPQSRSSQCILTKIIRLLGILDRHVEVHWIPARHGVPGDEEADVVAKRAAGWQEKGQGPKTPTPPVLLPLITAQKAVHHSHIMNKQGQEWNPKAHYIAPTRVRQLVRKLEPTPNRRVLDRYGALDKAKLGAALLNYQPT